MGLFAESLPEQVVSRKLASILFGGIKPLSKVVLRVGSVGQIAEFKNGAWLSVKATSGGTVFKVRGRDSGVVAEVIKAFEQKEIKNLIAWVAKSADN